MSKNILKRNTFWMALFTFTIAFFQIWYNSFSALNLNRTIGWGYSYGFIMDIEDIISVFKISFYSFPVFAIGYTALLLAKRRLNTIFFVLHLIIIFLTLTVPSDITFLLFIFTIASILTFILNIILSKKLE